MLHFLKKKIKQAYIIHNIKKIYELENKGLNDEQIIEALSKKKIFITEAQLAELISLRSSSLSQRKY